MRLSDCSLLDTAVLGPYFIFPLNTIQTPQFVSSASVTCKSDPDLCVCVHHCAPLHPSADWLRNIPQTVSAPNQKVPVCKRLLRQLTTAAAANHHTCCNSFSFFIVVSFHVKVEEKVSVLSFLSSEQPEQR